MGQAKIRGTREQRVAQAQERERARMRALLDDQPAKAVEVQPEAVPVTNRKPVALSPVETLALIAMLGAPMMTNRRGG